MRPPGSEGASAPDPTTPRLVVIGNFDGVHRGHQAVLRVAAEEAQKRALELLVLTFDPHPAEVLRQQSRDVLTGTERKVRLLRETVPGLAVHVERFDLALAALSPEDFATQILRNALNARAVLVGENFRFGSRRAGDLSTLQELGARLGFEAWAETLRGDEAGAFSSSRIRALLSEGKVREAGAILGRPHLLRGTVARGDARGRQLGFPTANLEAVQETVPAEGVYAVFVYDLASDRAAFLGPGVANLGSRPTVDRPAALEVHLLDFDSDLYDKTLGVTLVERIRGVEKFPNVEALQAQIEKDVKAARGITSQSFPDKPFAW